MAASILSVTCRPRAVRLLRLSRERGLSRITDLAERIPADRTDDPAALAGLAAQAAHGEGLLADRVILGLDGDAASLRRLRFPFTARNKIDLVLGPEFEPHLPFPLTEAALSWSRTSLEPAPATVALAAAYPLATLRAQLTPLAEAALPVDAACLDMAGLDALLGTLAPARSALLLWQDDERICFLCRLAGRPAIWRSLPVPTADTAEAAADYLAQEALRTVAAVSPRPPGDLRLFPAGPLPPGTREALARACGVQVRDATASPVWPRLDDGTPLPDRFAAVYGLALLAAAGPDTANFLRGPLAPAIPPAVKRRGLLIAGSAVAALIAAFALSLGVTYHRLNAAIETSQQRTAAIMTKAAPTTASGLTLAQQLSVLRGRLAEQRAEARIREASAGTAIELLAAIHTTLGQGGRVRVSRIAIDDRHATIDGSADDYNTVDDVKRRLAASKYFRDVEIKGAKNVPTKKEVEFQLDMQLAGTGGGGA